MAEHDLADKISKDFWLKVKKWTIDWSSEKDHKHHLDSALPEAHTHGLQSFGHPELQVRRMTPNLSEFILNLVASWIIGGYGTIADGDTIRFRFEGDTKFFFMRSRSEIYNGHDEKEKVLRLTWHGDP